MEKIQLGCGWDLKRCGGVGNRCSELIEDRKRKEVVIGEKEKEVGGGILEGGR